MPSDRCVEAKYRERRQGRCLDNSCKVQLARMPRWRTPGRGRAGVEGSGGSGGSDAGVREHCAREEEKRWAYVDRVTAAADTGQAFALLLSPTMDR
jgi:hypothetical protein